MTGTGAEPARSAAAGQSEAVDRVDHLDRVTGVTTRHAAVRHGWLHRVVAVVCRDVQGRVLVVERSLGEHRAPGRLEAFVGGAVRAGERYREAAVREVREELGIVVSPRRVATFLNAASATPHWMRVFECRVPAGPFSPAADEIAACVWCSPPRVCALAARGALTPESEAVLAHATAGRPSTAHTARATWTGAASGRWAGSSM